MRTVEIIREKRYHQLEEGRGYASVHILVSGEFDVITSPISTAGKEGHFEVLSHKIKSLEDG